MSKDDDTRICLNRLMDVAKSTGRVMSIVIWPNSETYDLSSWEQKNFNETHKTDVCKTLDELNIERHLC